MQQSNGPLDQRSGVTDRWTTGPMQQSNGLLDRCSGDTRAPTSPATHPLILTATRLLRLLQLP